jgi:starvation-inducible outer membrane lipoprotein
MAERVKGKTGADMKLHLLILIAALCLGACGKSEPPAPKVDSSTDTHPVKNVDALPAGNIREGGKLMNQASDLGKTMEQQKQDREKNSENK